MNVKTKNLKQEECESILEFLFNEEEDDKKELDTYIGKYLESQEKWRLVFECIQDINITSDMDEYFCALINNVGRFLPFLKMAVIIYNKEGDKNKVFVKNTVSSSVRYMADCIFPSFNMYNAHIEIAKYFSNAQCVSDYKIMPLETKNQNIEQEVGYIYFETDKPCEKSDTGYLEHLCTHITGAIETISLCRGIKKENNEKLENVASFSHEIKTPLNTIIAYSELLKKNSSTLGEELKSYVENICIGSYQLKNLLMDVIENAKLKYGKTVIRKQSFETKRAIEDVLKIFNCAASKKNIEFKTALMQVSIVSDYTKFNQILYNLISNAVKFSDNDCAVNITSWVEEGRYCFEIKNEGAGISRENIERVTCFLQSTDKNADKNPEGSGIGLYVSKQLAELLSGVLEFESDNSCTIFKFSLPLEI